MMSRAVIPPIHTLLHCRL